MNTGVELSYPKQQLLLLAGVYETDGKLLD